MAHSESIQRSAGSLQTPAELDRDNRARFYALLHDPETRVVGRDDFGSVLAAPGEMRRIATDSLAGCTAAVLVWADKDGNRYAHIQHYNPNNRLIGVRVLTAALKESQEQHAISSRAVVMGPGEWEGTNVDEQGSAILDLKTDDVPVDQFPAENHIFPYSRDPKSAAALVKALGRDTDAKLYLYDTAWGNPGSGAIVVELLPDGAANIMAESQLIPFGNDAPHAQ